MTWFRAWLVGLILLAAGYWSPHVQAGTGWVETFPQPRVRPRSGIRMTIDTRWVAGSGYRPARIRVQPLTGGLATSDRYFDVTVRPRGWMGGSRSAAATATVHLPQGQLYGEATVNIPQSIPWSYIQVDTYEDNNWLRDLSSDMSVRMGNAYYELVDEAPSVLVIDRYAPGWGLPVRGPAYAGSVNASIVVRPEKVPIAGGLSLTPLLVPRVGSTAGADELRLLPDVRVLARVLLHTNIYFGNAVTPEQLDASSPISDVSLMQLVQNLQYLELLPPSALPDHWVSYSGIDLIVIAWPELARMATEQPVHFEAIKTWLATGPTLCVTDLGSGFEPLADLERLLDLDVSTESTAPFRGWTKPSIKNQRNTIPFRQPVNAPVSSPLMPGGMIEMPGSMAAAAPPTRTPASVEAESETPPFVWRQAGLGQVVALGDMGHRSGDEDDWRWLFNSIPSRHWLWFQRNGVSLRADNHEFWNFLIPDIGRAPVVSFLAFISLFAVLIGPVNYWVLMRRGRLYLLLVTVPAGAFVVGASLFLYATLADGLGVRVRVRSYTELDQRRDRAVSWSRQTYYAGLAPAGGLVFPAGAAVYPIDHHPINKMGLEDTSRTTRWDDQQHLASGYFPSRSLSQFLVVEPQTTQAELRVDASNRDQAIEVVNNLGTNIERLLLHSADGRLYRGFRVAAGGTTRLEPATASDEADEWAALARERDPQYPVGFDPAQLENVTGIFGNSMWYRYNNHPPSLKASLMEVARLQAVPQVLSTPRRYVALVERPPLVSLGSADASETAGFHVLFGQW